MIEGVDRSARGEHDAGELSTQRVRPCALRTWCVLAAGHDVPCVEVPREKQEPTDFGPKAAKRRHWGK